MPHCVHVLRSIQSVHDTWIEPHVLHVVLAHAPPEQSFPLLCAKPLSQIQVVASAKLSVLLFVGQSEQVPLWM